MCDLSEDKLFEKIQDGYFITFSEDDFIYEGLIEDITDFPILFKKVLSGLQWTKYDDTEKKLKISGYDIHDIKMLNPLLKQPIFEVKALSLADVLAIEKEIAEKEQQKYE